MARLVKCFLGVLMITVLVGGPLAYYRYSRTTFRNLRVVKEGVDTFDCTVPTQYARHGTAFTSSGRVEITKSKFLNDKKPLDPKCKCYTCATYSRAYLCHLMRAKENTGGTLVTIHNLHYFQTLMANIRRDIKRGLI